MTVYEYGKQNDKQVLFIATAALEPYWAFQKQAEALGEDYHVYAVSADGHDGKPGDFISIEKTVSDMTALLKERGVTDLYAAYGLSMGGAVIVRFLATGGIPVERVIIDGGILPYTYPKWICTLMKELGLYDYVPAMCRLDYTMSEAGGETEFVREYTLASGGPYCDCGYHKRKQYDLAKR